VLQLPPLEATLARFEVEDTGNKVLPCRCATVGFYLLLLLAAHNCRLSWQIWMAHATNPLGALKGKIPCVSICRNAPCHLVSRIQQGPGRRSSGGGVASIVLHTVLVTLQPCCVPCCEYASLWAGRRIAYPFPRGTAHLVFNPVGECGAVHAQ